MADRAPFSLDLGIQGTHELDSMSAADNFLSGNTDVIEKIDPKKKDPAPAKKKEEVPETVAVEEEEVTDPLAAFDEEAEEEEETTGKEKKEKVKDEEEKADEPEGDSEFEIMSKTLLDLGVFTQGEEGEEVPKTAEEFAERFRNEKQKGASQWLDSFLRRNGEDRMDLFEAIFVNNVDPKDYLPAYNEVKNLETLDINQESNQEAVYREYYKRIGWTPDRIERRLQRDKDSGDLEDEAIDLHAKLLEQGKDDLLKKETAKKTEEAQKQQADATYRQGIHKSLTEALKAKELKGIPVTEKTAREAADFLTTPKYKLPNGELLTEFDKFILDSKKPENAEIRALIALLKGNNFDFSSIAKRAVSKESSALFTGLKKTAAKTRTTALPSTATAWSDL